ncbi:MAG TPA: hypothetical protein VGP25_10105 [Gemmatimonadaceae bacterium]|jgi:hypothetical protein|nr:hypothetical protein [Gemmatimonadaceae bacterium]
MTSSISNEPTTSTRKPIPSILAIGVLFLVLGVLDVWRGLAPMFGTASRLATDDMQVLAIGIAALAGGGFLLRGHDWARWLLAVWMLLHVAISEGPRQLTGHLLIFGFVAYLLFRPRAAASFGRRASG